MVRRHDAEPGGAATILLDRWEPPPRVPPVPRVLLVHAGSRVALDGVVRSLAQAIRGEGVEVDVVTAPAVHDVGGYDAIVVGTAVARRRWHRHARRFVRQHAGQLVDRPVWLFSCPDHGIRRRAVRRVRGVERWAERIDARGHVVFDPPWDLKSCVFVARSSPVVTRSGTAGPSAVDQWGRRVGATIVWAHHVRREVMRGPLF